MVIICLSLLLSIILLALGLAPQSVGILVALFNFASKSGGLLALIYPPIFTSEKRTISLRPFLEEISLLLFFYGSEILF